MNSVPAEPTTYQVGASDTAGDPNDPAQGTGFIDDMHVAYTVQNDSENYGAVGVTGFAYVYARYEVQGQWSPWNETQN
jgi:hypothetical protein